MTLESLFLDNPVLMKHVRSRLRPQHVYPGVACLVIVAAMIMYACVRLDGVRNGTAFAIFTGLQAFILFLGGSSQVAAAVSQARATGTLDFHRVSPVSPAAVSLGFMLGAPIREWVLAGCLVPFQLACVGWKCPGPVGYLEVLAITLMAAMLYHALGLLVGLTVKPQGASGVVVALVIALHMFGLIRLTVLPTVAESIAQAEALHMSTRFYGLTANQFVLSFIHMAPIFAFLFIAARRKMRHERAYPFAKPVAVLFHLVVAFYLLGNAPNWWRRGFVERQYAPVIVAYVMAVAGIFLASAVTPGWGDFVNGARRARKAGLARAGLWTDLAANWAPLFCLAAITVGATMAAAAMSGASRELMRYSLEAGLVAGLAALTFGSAYQTFGLAFRRAGTSYFALFLFIAWIAPLLLGVVASITEAPERGIALVLSFSPIAGIASTGIADARAEGNIPAILALVSGALMAGIFLAFRAAAEKKATG